MPQVELLCDVAEGGTELSKTPNSALKVTRSKRGIIEFRKGTVVEMTDDGADKWVKRGIAKVVNQPQAAKPADEKQPVEAKAVTATPARVTIKG